jgi:hypothetical protein
VATILKNFNTDFSGNGNGSTSNHTPWGDWNDWLAANATLNDDIILEVNQGTYATVGNVLPFYNANKARSVVIHAYGATFLEGASGYNWGTPAQRQDNLHSARLQTVLAGASAVTLISPGDVTLFNENEWALITGLCLQEDGYPSNPAFFEWVYITDITGSVITFSNPLAYDYKSTWPFYNGGSGLQVDQGGPATLYAIDPQWNFNGELWGAELSVLSVATNAQARRIRFKDVSVPSGQCPIPSQCGLWIADGCDFTPSTMEVDKFVKTIRMKDTSIGVIQFQNAGSIETFIGENITANYFLGTPTTTYLKNPTILTDFKPGAILGYGNSKTLVVEGGTTLTVLAGGTEDKGPGDLGVNNTYSMSNGIITIPSNGVPLWATPRNNGRPGGICQWRGSFNGYEGGFEVIDVTQSGTDTLVQTSLAGTWPAVQGDGDKLYIVTHSAPTALFRNVTGSNIAVDFSTISGAKPLFSCSTRTYGQGGIALNSGSTFPLHGILQQITITVTRAYTGAQGTLTAVFAAAGLGGTGKTYLENATWSATIDLKAAPRTIVITPSAVTGKAAGDTIAVPGSVMFCQSQDFEPSADISGEAQGLWPIFTVECIASQPEVPAASLQEAVFG